MPLFRRDNSRWLELLTVLLTLSLVACTPTARTVAREGSPVVLRDPLSTHTDRAALTVGTNRWPTAAAVLEEEFLPLAVTMHNNSPRPLCGGASTASLHSLEGAAVSAVLPTSVVTRLFGPLAAVEPEFPQRSSQAAGGKPHPLLLRVQDHHGGLMPSGGLQRGGLPRLAPLPFASPASPPLSSPFSSPFASPFSSPFASPAYPPFYSPFYSPFSSPFSSPFASPAYPPFASPFSSPLSPYSGSPFSPFSPYPRYDYGYALPLLPPAPPFAEPPPPPRDPALMREIVTAAFASRPLEPQEARTGFLFFPRPAARAQKLTLTWSWYDCLTRELMAHLSVPVDTRRP